jgi:hypothetical protein
MSKKPKILFYDIETTPLQAWVWRPGKQVVRHGQLVGGMESYEIICIGYAWLHSSESGCLTWDYKTQNSKKMIQQFTKMCDEADLIIGKNNRRFDDKHLNTLRLLHGLPGRPDLLSKVDDLESQIRRHFYLPSYTLDYVSKLFGFGGKTSMSFQDWIDIMEKNANGEKSFRKMVSYCKKDVQDTKKLWKALESHITPKFNHSVHTGKSVCKVCGSDNIRPNGSTRSPAGVKYVKYYCNDHKGHAGSHREGAKNPILKG